MWAHACIAVFLNTTQWIQTQMVDRIVAVVEQTIITERELQAKMATQKEAIEQQFKGEEKIQKLEALKKYALEAEINDVLIGMEITANRERLGVTEKDIDNAVEEVLKMNQMTQEALQSALYGQGLTWSEYRSKLKEQLERARIIQYRVQGKVHINDADAKRRCQERKKHTENEMLTCASHILLTVPSTSTLEKKAEILKNIENIRKKVLAGADFAEMANTYSEDKAAAEGKLGCFGKGEMVEAFEKTAFAMKVGDVSSVVETPFGYHIIKVTDRQKASAEHASCDTEESLVPFKNELYQEEMERYMQLWVGELRQKSFVEVRL
jgi:peptidyl-prolyl cis-trans isomerase SurA